MKLGSDMRKNWIMLNKLMGKSKKKISDNFIIGDDHCTDAATISEAFNEYFIDHPQNIQNTIGNSAGNYYNLIDDNLDSMFLRECEVVEVSKEISKLKKRGKVDDISGKFLKLSNEKVSPIICDLFNNCIRQGIFPECFKIASITPIFKKGNASLIKNHRPISVLKTLSKLFESIIFQRLQDFFTCKNLFNPNQYGFRRARSTELAIFSLIDNVSRSFVNKCFCICIFLDFSACFDTICRQILLRKMLNMVSGVCPMN